MLKKLSFTIAASVLLSACGGNSDKKAESTSPSSSSASSAAVIASSSSVATSSSSAASSTSVASSSEVATSSSSVASSAPVASSSSVASSTAVVTSSSTASSSSKGSSVASSTVASSSSVSSAAASSSSASGTTYTFSSITGWTVNGGGSPNDLQVAFDTASGSGIDLVPISWADNAGSSYKYEALYTLPAAFNIVAGSKITFTVSVPQSYITDGNTVLQLNWGKGGIQKYGGPGGGYKALSGATAGTDFVITETVASGSDVAGADTLGIQFSKAPTSTSILDKILIKNIKLQ